MARKTPTGVIVPIRMPGPLWRDTQRVARTRYKTSGAALVRAALRLVLELPDPSKDAKEAKEAA